VWLAACSSWAWVQHQRRHTHASSTGVWGRPTARWARNRFYQAVQLSSTSVRAACMQARHVLQLP
jgi:hypothetical protein